MMFCERGYGGMVGKPGNVLMVFALEYSAASAGQRVPELFIRCAGRRSAAVRARLLVVLKEATVVVPGMVTVTASCEMMYLRKNCAQEVMSSSCVAHAGTGVLASAETWCGHAPRRAR